MGYNQTTNLFYGVELEWTDGPDLYYYDLPQGSVWVHESGDSSTGTNNRYWVVAQASWINLSSGTYETYDAVNVTDLTWEKGKEIKQWTKDIEEYVKDHNLTTKGLRGWIAAASGS